MKTIIAIDPGSSGGFAVRSGNGHLITGKLHPEPREMLTQFYETISDMDIFVGDRVCYLEQLTGWIEGSHATGTTSFKMGRNYGHIEMMMASEKIPVVPVMPRNWQSVVMEGATKKGTEIRGGNWKSLLADKARRLFPKTNVTLYNADALLILKYAMGREGIDA